MTFRRNGRHIANDSCLVKCKASQESSSEFDILEVGLYRGPINKLLKMLPDSGSSDKLKPLPGSSGKGKACSALLDSPLSCLSEVWSAPWRTSKGFELLVGVAGLLSGLTVSCRGADAAHSDKPSSPSRSYPKALGCVLVLFAEESRKVSGTPISSYCACPALFGHHLFSCRTDCEEPSQQPWLHLMSDKHCVRLTGQSNKFLYNRGSWKDRNNKLDKRSCMLASQYTPLQ